MKWELVKKFGGGHSFWRDEHGGIAIADQSADVGTKLGTPEQTDDGVLYLVKNGLIRGNSFDIVNPVGEWTQTSAREDELVWLIQNHGYRYELGKLTLRPDEEVKRAKRMIRKLQTVAAEARRVLNHFQIYGDPVSAELDEVIEQAKRFK